MLYDRNRHAEFKRICQGENPPVADCLAWLAYREGKGEQAEHQVNLVRKFVEAVQNDDPAIGLVAFPALQQYLNPGYRPHVTRKVLDLVGGGIMSGPGRSLDGYAWDLHLMARVGGPESPFGWKPFTCTLGGRIRGLLVGLVHHPRDEAGVLYVISTIAEVVNFGVDDTRLWWWLALNGPSCAASPMPLAQGTFAVSPTPEQLIGYPTQQEQLERQRFCLEAPIKEVARYMREVLPRRLNRGEVAYTRPAKPEAPSRGPTAWLAAGTRTGGAA